MKLLINLTILLLLPFMSFAAVEPIHLSQETYKRISLVPEFKFIQEEADKLGVKVYLFGGTASAFAHYVRWDLEREAGDEKYQAERFDYDFTNIYRGNQDLDIVVDGTAEQAKVLQGILQDTYPHFVGDRDAWEVRLLKEQTGDKLPLLDDPNFLNQHTDTNSTGMIAINATPEEIIYRDLFNWQAHDSSFLNDVASGRINFLFSDQHETTKRFKENLNPPILAAIRYIAKLTQYEVIGTEEDLALVTQIIQEQNLKELSKYSAQKAGEFGLKALLNSPDVEFAWNILEKTGLRLKLLELDQNQVDTVNTLSWWMNKEPLRSRTIEDVSDDPELQTAQDIFGDEPIILSHETNGFIAYENLTRSVSGRVNAFISREGVNGEAAVHGEGLYAKIGDSGARGTNLTIRFILAPNAVLNKDFTQHGDFIVIKNKNAVKLIQEDIGISLIDYIKLLDNGEIKSNDKGLQEKFIRKFNRLDTSSKEFLDAVDFVMASLKEDFSLLGIDPIADNNSPTVSELINIYLNRGQYPFSGNVSDFLHSLRGQELTQAQIEAVSRFLQKSKQIMAFRKYLLTEESDLKPSGLYFVFNYLSELNTTSLSWSRLGEFNDLVLVENSLSRFTTSQIQEVKDIYYSTKTKENKVLIIKNILHLKNTELTAFALQKIFEDFNNYNIRAFDIEIRSADYQFTNQHIKNIKESSKKFLYGSKHKFIEKLLRDLDLLELVFPDPIERHLFSTIAEVYTFSGLIEFVDKQENGRARLIEVIQNKYSFQKMFDSMDEKFISLMFELYQPGAFNNNLETFIKNIFSQKPGNLSFRADTEINSFIRNLISNPKKLAQSKFLQDFFFIYLKNTKVSNLGTDREPTLLNFFNSKFTELPFISNIIDIYCARLSNECNHLLLNFVISEPSAIHYPKYLEVLIHSGFEIDKKLAGVNGPFYQTNLAPRDNRYYLDFKDQLEADQEKYNGSVASWKSDYTLAKLVFTQQKWALHPTLLEFLIKKDTVNEIIITDILSKEYFSNSPFLISLLLDMKKYDRLIVEHVLSKPHWLKYKDLALKVISNETADDLIIERVLSNYPSEVPPETIQTLIERGGREHLLAEHIFSKLPIAKNLKLIKDLIDSERAGFYVVKDIASRNEFIDEGLTLLPPLLSSKQSLDSFLDHYVFSSQVWKRSDLATEYLSGEVLSAENLRLKMQTHSFEEWMSQRKPFKKLTCSSILHSSN